MNGTCNGVQEQMNGHKYNTVKSTTNHSVNEVVKTNGVLNIPKNLTADDVNFYTYELINGIATYLMDRTDIRPKIGIICGSGIGSLADHMTDRTCFPYSSIPHFPTSTVFGHKGQLVFGRLNGVQTVCMQGRFHTYEGYPLWKCAMPVRVMHLVGVTHIIVSNAAGGLNQDYRVGDIMIIKDHINLMGFAGNSPLQGPNDERFGSRFTSLNNAYDAELRSSCRQMARDMGINHIIHEGVYTCLGGPNFETIAELKLLMNLGVDAVGMSTVPEVLVARHCGMTVFGFSLITNECLLDYETQVAVDHQEVMDTGVWREDILKDLVCRMVRHMEDTMNTGKEKK